MPPKKILPRKAKRLPKGHNRHDYEPEAWEAYVRDKWRQFKARHRARQRHAGYRDVTFALSRDARANLARLSKETGLSKSKFLTHLLEQFNDEHLQDKPHAARPDQPDDGHAAGP